MLNHFSGSTDMHDAFLKHNAELFTYAHLYHYAEEWISSNAHKESSVITIVGNRSTDTILKIASCWLHGIPFTVVPPDTTASEIEFYKSAQVGLKSIKHDKSDNSLAAILFTSGTTGSPKTVPLKRSNISAAAKASIQNFAIAPGEFWIHTLPLHHIGGLSIIIRALHSHSAINLPNDTSIDTIRNLINHDGSTVGVSLVPTQLRRLLGDSSLKPHPDFKGILLGGGPVNADDIQSCISKGLRVIPSFGMTETAAQCLAAPYYAWQQTPPGSCGVPLAGVEAELRPDPEDTSSSLLWLRGKQVFDGYYGVSSDDIDDEGWFCTGDYARRDDDGYYYIVMRRSDRIVSGGENINPAEIEQVIANNNIIAGEYAIIGLPDPEWGQIVTLVTTNQQALPLETIRDKLSEELSRFKLPKALLHMNHIPKTAAGKIKRKELVAIVLSQLEQ